MTTPIQIITDSACDLPPEIINHYRIEVLPFIIRLNDRDYLDGVTIKTEELYAAMRNGAIPKTSQISPSLMRDCFLKHAEAGDQCLYISFSSEFSGAYQTSLMMRDEITRIYPDFDLKIIDSGCGSLATGILVRHAAELSRNCVTMAEIIASVTLQAKCMEHIFTVDQIEYLYRSGRMNKTNAFIGGILNVKPLIHLVNGKVLLLGKIRGKTRAVIKLFHLMEERCATLKDQVIGIAHADDLESALKLKEMIQKRFGYNQFIINQIGAALGAHLGIGGVGLFFLNKSFSYLS